MNEIAENPRKVSECLDRLMNILMLENQMLVSGSIEDVQRSLSLKNECLVELFILTKDLDGQVASGIQRSQWIEVRSALEFNAEKLKRHADILSFVIDGLRRGKVSEMSWIY